MLIALVINSIMCVVWLWVVKLHFLEVGIPHQHYISTFPWPTDFTDDDDCSGSGFHTSNHDMTWPKISHILFDSSYELDSSIFIGWCYAYDNFNISLARFTGSIHASWEFQLCMSCSGCISLNNLMFYRVTSDIMTDDICLENDDISAYRNVTHFNYYEGNTRRALDVTYFPR